MHLRSGVFLAFVAVCIASALAQADVDNVEETPTYYLHQGIVRNEPRSLNAESQLFEADNDEPALHREARRVSHTLPKPAPWPTPSPTFPRPPSDSDLWGTGNAEPLLYREARSISHSFPRPGPRPAPSPTFPRPPSSLRLRFRRDAETEPQLYEIDADEPVLHREARRVSQHDLHRPVIVRPTPSPTFPRPPSSQMRFRRDVGTNEADPLSSSTVEEGEAPLRVVRTLQPYRFPPKFPGGTGPTFPRPEDILARHPQHRFRRQSGRVSVDVEKNRGGRPTTRLSAETNVYKSGNGRTRLDVGGYATNRGDRGGSINFTHRF